MGPPPPPPPPPLPPPLFKRISCANPQLRIRPTNSMLAYATTQSRAPGPRQGQSYQFSQAQDQAQNPPFGEVSAAANAFSFPSNPSAAQQSQAPFGQVFQAQAQARPQAFNQSSSVPSSGPAVPAGRDHMPAQYTPAVFQPAASQGQQVAQPSAAFGQPSFHAQCWPSGSQAAQAPIFSPSFPTFFQPVCQVPVQPSFGVPAARPRAAMDPKLAAAVSPALSLNCRQGHGLVCISGKPARYADWGCDLCHQPIPHDTKFVMHCDKCASDGPIAAGAANGFDICPACRAKASNAMSIWPLILNAAGCPMFPGVGDYWQTLYCHRQQAPFKTISPLCCVPVVGLPPTLSPCGPRQGEQCLDCKRGQDALVASVEGKLLNRAGRAISHVCYGPSAGMYFCSECSGRQAQCEDCKFTQANLPAEGT
jgi:hypothetical protein